MGNIIQDGIMLIASEFVILLTYIVISSPVASMIISITSAGTSMGVTQMAHEQMLVDSVFSICMLILALVPVIWFVFRMYQRNPDWGYR